MTLAPEYGAFEAHKINVGRGWWPLLTDVHRQLDEIWPEYEIAQVKEKWGGLRIYLDYPLADDDADELALRRLHEACGAVLAEIEDRSQLTCEFCGQPGVRRSSGWIKTMCDDCSGGAPASPMKSLRNGGVTWHRMETQ